MLELFRYDDYLAIYRATLLSYAVEVDVYLRLFQLKVGEIKIVTHVAIL